MTIDTSVQTIQDYQRTLREPLMSAEYRERYNNLPDKYKLQAEDNLREERFKPLYDMLYTVTNVMGERDLQWLARYMARKLHRTLVQSFARSFIVPFLKTIKEDGDAGFVDARSQATYEFAKRVLEQEQHFPFI